MEVAVWQRCVNYFYPPEQAPVREPTRFDFILLPLLNAKDWLVSHPITAASIAMVLVGIAADRLDSRVHAVVCRCMDDKGCPFGFMLKQLRFMILCHGI